MGMIDPLVPFATGSFAVDSRSVSPNTWRDKAETRSGSSTVQPRLTGALALASAQLSSNISGANDSEDTKRDPKQWQHKTR